MMSPRLDTGPLEPVAEGLWQVVQHRSVPGFHVANRMSVVQLPSGGLWLYSPVTLEPELSRSLAELGPVEHIFAPSRVHHLYAGHAKRAHPQATLWAAPGLPAKRRDLAWDEVWDQTRAESGGGPWPGVLEGLHIPGSPVFNEVAFHHRPSKSLLCCDFIFAVDTEPSWISRLMFRAMGVWKTTAQSRVWRALCRDRSAQAEAVERLLAWPIERVVPAHGGLIDTRVEARLRAALAWLPTSGRT